MMWKMALPFLASILAVALGSNVGHPPGGPQDIDVKDPEFQKAVDFAVREYNHHTDHHHYYALIEVLKAQYQVVAGVNYIMTLKLGKTKCLKYSISDYCPVIEDPHKAKFITCTFTVWYNAHHNKKEVIGASCREN